MEDEVTNHFDFLIEDADRAFFQEVAADRAIAAPRAPLAKTASATGLDKLASQLDADLVILERAGSVGVELGMTKRAMLHVARLADDPRLLARPGAMPDLFGKVAAAAVAADMAAATAALCKVAAPEELPELRREVAQVGYQLAASLEELRASIEKSAAGLGLGGLGRAGLVAKELRGASNLARGAIGGAEESLGRLGRRFRAGQALKARANVRQIGEEMRAAGQAGRSAGAERAIAEGQKQQLAKAQESYAARRRAALARSPASAAVGALAEPAPKPPAATAPSAGDAKPESSPTTGGERKGGSGPLDLLKKLHTQGWSALAPQEKTHLVAGGAGLIGAHRLMTGRDLLTGDKDE